MSQCEGNSLLDTPGLPRSAQGAPVFAEPWQAQAFALTVHLHERGVFDWREWAACLSRRVHEEGRAQDGSDYFEAWVGALCDLLEQKGVADAATVLDMQLSWQRAAIATPHGQPIELDRDPLRLSRTS